MNGSTSRESEVIAKPHAGGPRSVATASKGADSCQFPVDSGATERVPPLAGRGFAIASSEIARADECGLESGAGQDESDNLHSVCWVCGQKQSDPGCEKVVKMCGDGRDESFLKPCIRWKTLEVLIPRCQACAERERLQGDDLRFRLIALAKRADKLRKSWRCKVLGLKSVHAELLAINGEEDRLRSALKELKHEEFPVVRRLLSEGWEFGERPSEFRRYLGRPPSVNSWDHVLR